MAGCEMGSVPLVGAEWIAEAVSTLHGAYAHIHPYIAVALCMAGTAMNAVTVVVLTRPSMLSPVNALLCAVAVCDILVMSSVLIFVSHFMIIASMRCDVSDYDRVWAYFLFAHSQGTVILHAGSIWLTVLLAQIRVYTIKRATSGPANAVSARATGVIAIITLGIVAVVNIPNFLTFEIVEIDADLWLPCLLPVTENNLMESERMMSSLVNIIQNTTEIPNYGSIFHVRASEGDCGLLKVMNKKRMPRDHTTPMLVAVLSIFLLAELPQGILHVCNAIYSNETFYQKIYLPLGDLMDLLSLLNSAVNFIIYCAMSRKFRCVFLQLFFSCLPNNLYRRVFHILDEHFID
uniref:G_PROTEIN_RECEP_F1_2 domain-containing protein n=1 Tax=Heterorhabditis bacteriophora TaxID=37862 RepID=A0A1I7XMP5_HETBA